MNPSLAGSGLFALLARFSAIRRSIASGPMWPARSRTYCCPICQRLEVVQYNVRPAGNVKPKIPNMSGISLRMACCWPLAAPGGLACCI